MEKPSPALLRLAALPLLALPLAALLSLSSIYQRLSETLDDGLLQLTAKTVRYDEVLAVDIDDASLRTLQPQLGDWPYERDVYALLLNYLRDAGVRLVVFDIVFAGPREGDAAFAAALLQRHDVVLAAAGLKQVLDQDRPGAALLEQLSRPAAPGMPSLSWPDATLPQPLLLKADAGPGALGLISTPLDADGRLRHLPLLHEVRGRLLPSLPLAALTRQSQERWAVQGGQMTLGTLRWPIDAQGRVRLVLPANADAVPTLNWARLMAAALGAQDDAALRKQLQGRTLFLGSSAFFADAVMTPLGQMSGTRLLASAYATLGRGQVLGNAGWPWHALLWLTAGLPALWIWRRRQPQLLHLLAPTLVALAAVLGCGLMLRAQHLYLPLLGPLTALALSQLLTGIAQLRWEHKANQRLRYERAVAEAANQAKSEFLANVSHEIRTPMNALLGMAELLAKTRMTEQQQRYLDVFHSAGQSLFELINDLLDNSKIEAGKLELQPRAFNPEQLFGQQLALLRPRAESQGLQLLLRFDAGARGWAVGDPQLIGQILVNLVGNAIKFTRQGDITVSARRDPHSNEFHFSVQDTGIGIAPSKHELIFRPFTQADGSVSRLFGGTGLGLSISRSLVAMMGGRIWLESLPGRGTTFHVQLPLAPAKAPVEALVPVTSHAPAAQLAPLNILLCEDNEVNVMVVEAMLAPQGHRIEVAENGALGLHKFRSGRYDIVLMDVQMPGMDGHTATRELRRIEAEEERVRTPVIALTANAFDRDARLSLSAGCDDHLTKPISQEALLQALARHARTPVGGVQSAQPSAPATLAVPPGGADPEQHQRRLAHAAVFLGGWRQAWATAEGEQARRLVNDLAEIAGQIGATRMAAAAGVLASALDQADLRAAEQARQDIEAALAPLLVELSTE